MPKDQKKSIDNKLSNELDFASSAMDVIPVIGEKSCEMIYGEAYNLYNAGNIDDASKLFKLLVIIDSENSKHAMALGACHQMKKEYKDAVDVYTHCSMIDADNPVPYFHTADCYLKMNDPVSAIICLELAIEHSMGIPQFEKLAERSKMTIETLKKNIGIKPKKKPVSKDKNKS